MKVLSQIAAQYVVPKLTFELGYHLKLPKIIEAIDKKFTLQSGFEMDRNAPERRSGSSFGDRNAVPVHFLWRSGVFFSATGTPFLLNVINLVPTNRSGLPKQYFGNT
jgi:hypothetical protein